MQPELSSIALLQRQEIVDGRIAKGNPMLDVEPVFPHQESGQAEVHPKLVGLDVHAGAGTHIIVAKLRNESVRGLVEVLILKLNVTQTSRLAKTCSSHIAVLVDAGARIVAPLGTTGMGSFGPSIENRHSSS